jgi:hypothetical protein
VIIAKPPGPFPDNLKVSNLKIDFLKPGTDPISQDKGKQTV